MDRHRRDSGTLPRSAPAISRWLGALDALAPYLIAVTAIAIARHAFASPFPGTVATVVAIIALATGTAFWFFWDMSDAHLTWPVAFALFVLLVPLLALHVSLESVALGEPVAIQLLPIAFTWTALLIVTCLIIGATLTTGAAHPGWVSVVIAPLAVLLGTIPVLSLDPSRPAVLTAVLYIFALAEIASGVAWLMPERHRWSVAAILLVVAAFVIARAFVTTPHHFPGRILLVVDAALALLTGAAALASPLLCRWLAGMSRGRKKARP